MIKQKIFLLLVVLLFIGCKTIDGSRIVVEKLNYTNEDVRQNEIQNIRSIQQVEPVKALWRACVLNDKSIIDECSTIVEIKLNEAIKNGDYLDAKRFYKSLQTINRASKNSDFDKLEKNAYNYIPGSVIDKSKTPKNIKECINATVTIWVDNGIKVQNGVGYSDIIIGSGFFIDKRGYIVTNYHVISNLVDPKYEHFSRLYIKLISDSNVKIPAKVIGYDSLLDLALLKVEIEPEYILSLGSSKDLKIGESVSAIGTPIGLDGTITTGVISSVNRKLLPLGDVFQIDAAVNSGNSGGPLIDKNMNVQAIVFAGMLQYQGLNFAIPVEYLKQELLILYKDSEVLHPWISAYGHTKKYGNKNAGLEIKYVTPGGSAFVSTLKENDIITSIDGNTITSIEDYQYSMMKYQPGTILSFQIENEDGKKNIYVYLERRPENPAADIYGKDFLQNSFIPIFGMKLIPSSTLNKNSFRIDKIINGSVADMSGFAENDRITVNNVKIDIEKNVIYATFTTRTRKNAYIDISLGLSVNLDSPYYL
ncbi:MAG: PDZ domain-containing protein [Treponema sp.]|nr:PDZ domain-containing protein [Treponema sp.]